ncbi:MAG: hypothetical protein A2958_03300 [Candidatus Levybacteria bacterium RIFCSPLOWO2_01_FULL_38_13]|uniref:Orotate phosphoribosyltransferase n=1 Tax=Candidatus Roizmanbacteria bacterium RIFCSPHIGHO2_12_FULL_33_9 TaxID=1802045 RepID=A0A1F7HJA4_9BACT|nr:MAG: hypothetical protein A2629_03715 [Candidatus Levybacteria bacterium RIFCSPHIGHO2_01_FULL_41_15]OGH35354.1 MAG: hypothetical protein A2958_03300 [Candidatus Levybacteria bacterium RIFCSPLOWO2_01_FULL_38_13]OGK31300.1 MAG: hypothetical protein A3F29_02425 [Candidatus Roizmanbacteria bacterium RIFCSPHIGHO2_12_FULL_33_9]
MFERAGVIQEGHFRLASGLHTSKFVEKTLIYPYTKDTSDLCEMIAQDFKDKDIGIVVAPAVGGVILSDKTATHLSRMNSREVLAVFVEKIEGRMRFRNNELSELVEGKNALIVDDVLTTGKSIRDIISAVQGVGGVVVGVAVLCNRGDVRPEDVGVDKIDALITLKLDLYKPEECPCCTRNEPLCIT